MEAPTGFEPAKKGFADLCVTIPPQRQESMDNTALLYPINVIDDSRRQQVAFVCKTSTHYNYYMYKQCTVCLKTKDKEEFFFRNKQKHTLHSQCKNCYSQKRRATWKFYYHKHGSKYRENAVKRNRETKRRLRLKMLEYLEGEACVKCGIQDNRVLEFDHVDPSTKSFSIARGIADTRSWENILNEISKCQILCANCHKIKTSKEQRWYKSG